MGQSSTVIDENVKHNYIQLVKIHYRMTWDEVTT